MSTPSTPVTAPLRLDEFFIESFTIYAPVAAVQQGQEADDPELGVDVGAILRVPDDLRFLVPLTVALKWPGVGGARKPPSLRLQMAGFFSLESGTDEHQALHLISLNAPSILYGIARGIIVQSLALTAIDKYILPSVNFIEVMRQREAQGAMKDPRRVGRTARRRAPSPQQPAN